MARRALGLRARDAGRLAFEINGRPRQNPAYRPARLFVSFAWRQTNYVDAAVPTGTSLTSLGERARQKIK